MKFHNKCCFFFLNLWGLNYAYDTWNCATEKDEVHGPNSSNTQELHA